ncbi:UNVERIFIED_CONTAM: Transmembrane protein 14C, partial [Gekko kuhli]
MAVDWIGYSYAVLVASGGIIGYAKAGSVQSLAAGLLFGGLAGLGAYQLSQDPKKIWISLPHEIVAEVEAGKGLCLPDANHYGLNAVASGTLAGVMGMRFYNSGKFMPAGLIAGASLLMVGRLGLKMYERPQKG